MVTCSLCGAQWADHAVRCSRCGKELTAATADPTRLDRGIALGAPVSGSLSQVRQCPACGLEYGPSYADSFCTCGTELRLQEFVIKAKSGPDRPSALKEALSAARSPVVKPAPGQHCLVLYGHDRLPVHYFVLSKDVTTIGRQDPVAGCFPDVDVSVWLDEATARRVSREHAAVLHSRRDQAFYLRPLAGNTGTQIDADMVPALSDYLLRPGTRLILGGAVRLKFEIS